MNRNRPTSSTTQIMIPLDIPDVEVLQTELTERDEIVLTVESTRRETTCHRCGRRITKLHGHDGWVVVRHLSILGRTVYLRYRPRRYRCPYCSHHPTTTEEVVWHESKSPNTKAYDDHLLVQLINATITDVAAKENLPYDKVLGVLERRIAEEVNWETYTTLGVIGLDEIALKKGHRDFVVIVSARLSETRLAILAVLPDRKMTTIQAFLESIPIQLRSTIHTVCSDMYEGYLTAVHTVLPQAVVVIDRFHVARQYREAADKVRKTELKRLKQELATAEYQQLQGHRWIFRKAFADLKPDEQKLLQKLFDLSPTLKVVHTLRESLTAIFEQVISKSEAQSQLRLWVEQVRESPTRCFDGFLQTLERLWEEITNYFIDRQTSGFVEGLNNKLKVLKRRCYGLFNLTHFFQRAFLDLEGYRLFA